MNDDGDGFETRRGSACLQREVTATLDASLPRVFGCTGKPLILLPLQPAREGAMLRVSERRLNTTALVDRSSPAGVSLLGRRTESI